MYQDLETGQRPPFYRSKIFLIILAILVVAIVGITLGVVLTRDKPTAPSAGAMASMMSIEDIMNTLEQLEAIAVNNSNNRALGTTGYAASVALVKQILAGFPALQVEEQTFVVPYATYVGIPTLAQTQPSNVTFTYSVDYLPLSASMGSGTFVARLESVANLGCNASDFAGFTAGRIALILRGNCTFQIKVNNALAAGAVAAVIYNDGADASRMAPFLGALDVTSIPVYSLEFSLGEVLRADSQSSQVFLAINASTVHGNTSTTNVIASTTTGRTDRVVIVGSHLDSVPAGPGINDNGSGSAVNLALAMALASLSFNPVNQIKFAWWAAEEEGLLGSTHYVNSLSAAQLANISCNLNFDMLGSPNPIRAIYDGNDAEDASIRNASTVITNMFAQFFDSYELGWELTAFDGRSDYGPFIANGIPAGGLFTGAEEIKTVEQRLKYGGLAEAAYDPCYHLYCDTVPNIDRTVLLQNAQNAATALQTLAFGDIDAILGPRAPKIQRNENQKKCVSNFLCK